MNPLLISGMNLIGLILGAAGSLLLAFYGLPNIKVLFSGAYTSIDVTSEIQRSQRMAKIGIWSLFAGFLFQAGAQIAELCLA